MRSENNLIKTFANCFRLLVKLNADTQDGFFVDLLAGESDKLLAEYIELLKTTGENKPTERTTSQVVQNARLAMSYKQHLHNVAQTKILQHQNVAKSADIVQHLSNVAQCRHTLVSRIKSILNLLNILNHLDLAKAATPLLLKRELLKLQLLLLNYNRPESLPRGIEVSGNLAAQKNNDKNKNTKPVELNELHKQIAGFIQSKERVQNIEVFGQFADTTKRTLKRKLSELIKAGVIQKQAKGKEVYYFPHK